MTDPLRDHDPRLEEWERATRQAYAEAKEDSSDDPVLVLIDRVRALEHERSEAREAHLSWKADAHRLERERDEEKTATELQRLMTKAACEERNEARAVAREAVYHLDHEHTWPETVPFRKKFDALPWAKD